MDVDICITASGIEMVRGKDLGVKEQRKVNQWNQYCKYRESLHRSSDGGEEGLMTLWLWPRPSSAQLLQKFPVTHWRKFKHLITALYKFTLTASPPTSTLPQDSLDCLSFPVHTSLSLHTLFLSSQVSIRFLTLARTSLYPLWLSSNVILL